jgi:2Fe-2S ferredoxin
MTKVTYTAHDGASTTLDVPAGENLMKAATRNGVPGITGECGGVLSCATCHVFVDPTEQDQLPAVTPAEDEMLEGTAVDREPTSRLSCQIVTTDDYDALHVTTPEFQE